MISSTLRLDRCCNIQTSRQKVLCCRSIHRTVPSPASATPAAVAVAAATRHGLSSRRRRCTRLRSVWDDSLTLSDLRKKLDTAVANEDYAEAARVRDALQQRQTDAKLAIEDANERFYAAFRSGNLQAMQEVWGEGDQVQVMHPASACIAGREMVIESWAAILRGVRPNAFKITLEDVRVYALSETTGLVTCVEIVEADDSQGRTVATNVFELQKGKWVIILHQGGPLPLSRFR